MSIITKTTAQKIAEKIDASQQELASHIASMLNGLYAAVNTCELQQEILDAFGNKAVDALTKYEAMRQALAIIDPLLSVPEPDLTIFQPQPDGRVIYVPVPTPETQPE